MLLMIGEARGHVVLISEKWSEPDGHERMTRTELAQRLARIIGYEFSGEHDASRRYGGHVYFVPDGTLLREHSNALGIVGECDVFGGVVPFPFVATKAITHPLVAPAAKAPAGWSHGLGARLADATLPGYSAFGVDDARTAAARLLQHGSVRVKPANVAGGIGQAVVRSVDELDDLFSRLDAIALDEHGVVVEKNLEKPRTYSVGTLRVADMRISYHGTQRLTVNHHGHEVYGGSDLVVTRGAFGDLLRLDVAAPVRAAIEKAVAYDAIVAREFPGLLASRRNYDVAEGHDREGRLRCGVLEQSWRLGGASAAEIAAIEAFMDDPDRHVVRASTREVYSAEAPPPGAKIHFRGYDASVGFLTKYSTIERNGHQS